MCRSAYYQCWSYATLNCKPLLFWCPCRQWYINVLLTCNHQHRLLGELHRYKRWLVIVVCFCRVLPVYLRNLWLFILVVNLLAHDWYTFLVSMTVLMLQSRPIASEGAGVLSTPPKVWAPTKDAMPHIRWTSSATGCVPSRLKCTKGRFRPLSAPDSVREAPQALKSAGERALLPISLSLSIRCLDLDVFGPSLLGPQWNSWLYHCIFCILTLTIFWPPIWLCISVYRGISCLFSSFVSSPVITAVF